jgi:hypothetical protein
MANHVIRRGDDAFELRTDLPTDWDMETLTGIDVDIYTRSGDSLVSAESADMWDGGTLDSEAVAGESDVVLAADGALVAGDRIALGSAALGYQIRTVRAYDDTTYTVSLDRSLDNALPSGAYVWGMWASYDLDASGSEWDGVDAVTVEWTPDTDDLPMMQLWTVAGYTHQQDGYEADFALTFPQEYEALSAPQAFGVYHRRAIQWLNMYFEHKGRDWKRIVDNDLAREAISLKTALLIGLSYGMDDDRFGRLSDYMDAEVAMLDALPIWSDSDEDHVEEDEETQQADDPGIERGL